MNKGLTEVLKTAFPNIEPIPRPEIESLEIKDPHWLVGFAEAEGCFLVAIRKSNTFISGCQVQLKFQLTQHYRDYKLLESFINYLGCVKYQVYSGQSWGYFSVAYGH